MNASDELASSFTGEQIAQVLRSSGPTVSCVLLRTHGSLHRNNNDKNSNNKNDNAVTSSIAVDTKPPAVENNQDAHDSTKAQNTNHQILTHLIEEIKIDTTPKKQMVSQILGGPFTFLGQYEDEGIVVIVRRPEDSDGGHRESNCEEEEEEDNHENDEDDDLNPHVLQPPLHRARVRGDILLMRVAATADADHDESETGDKKKVNHDGDDDDKDGEDDDEEKHNQEDQQGCHDETDEVGPLEKGQLLSNEDFFLDYTKEEYIKFASRTDIVAEDNDDENDESSGESEDEDYDDEEEEDADYNVESDDEEDGLDDEECQVGVMNLILAQLLRKFREENGRGPNTTELLTMRSALAAKLGIDERLINEEYNNSEHNESTSESKRKMLDGTGSPEQQREKRVKFTNEDEVKIMTDDEGGAVENGSHQQVEDAM